MTGLIAAAEDAAGDPVAAAWIAAGATVVVAVVGGLFLLAQQRLSARIGQPKTGDRDTTVAEQLAEIMGHVLHLAESHAAVEQRVDMVERAQILCKDCPRHAILAGIAGN